jgi:hypothetical protein
MPITEKDYGQAILAQDACNLSGLVHSLSQLVDKLWADPECTGTDWVNTHPLVVMYVSKLVSLSGAERGLVFSHAYEVCRQKAKKIG